MTRFFIADDWYTLTGGQRVATFAADKMPPDLYDPDQMRGEIVDIDGQQYRVVGVESFCILRSPEHPYRGSFGLAVSPAGVSSGTEHKENQQ